MSISILGGSLKGQKISVPSHFKFRPTSVVLRRKFFDTFQFTLSDYHFVDCCAGSGAVGLEAFSRGVESVTLVENNKKFFNQIEANLKNLKIENHIRSKMSDCLSIPKFIDLDSEDFFLFFDPPYEKKDLYQKFFLTLVSNNYQGMLAVEACRQKTMPSDDLLKIFNKETTKVISQGTSYIQIFDFS